MEILEEYKKVEDKEINSYTSLLSPKKIGQFEGTSELEKNYYKENSENRETLLDLCFFEKFSLPDIITDSIKEDFCNKIDEFYLTSKEKNNEGIMIKFPAKHTYYPNNRNYWLKVIFFS